MSKSKRPAVVKTANPEMAAAMRDLRRSSAASPHKDRRTRRVRTRSAARRAAMADY